MTRDLRRYARQTNIRLFGGLLFLLFVLGDGLIWAFYGKQAALLGMLCAAAALAPLLLIAVLLALADWVVKRANGH